MQGFDALRFGVVHLRGIGPGTLELSVWLQRSLAAVLNPARRAPPDMGHTAASLGRPAQGTGGGTPRLAMAILANECATTASMSVAGDPRPAVAYCATGGSPCHYGLTRRRSLVRGGSLENTVRFVCPYPAT